jgi:hypothetical protein
MIHYHGTPMTPRAIYQEMAGKHYRRLVVVSR